MRRGNLDPKKLMLLLIVAVVILQVGSILVSKIIDVPVLKLGFAIMLVILASGLAVLVNVSFNFGSLKKEDFLYLFIVVGACVGLYIYLPTYFPELFSIFRQGIFSSVVS